MWQPTRPILLTAIICTLSLSFSPAHAHPNAGASDYAKATRLLTQGKNFEQAISLLQTAVQAQHKNADYHLALGCAYADRAFSIAYARSWQWLYEQDKANYSKDFADWQADQKREPSPWPAPTKPPATFQAYTKDDGKPLALSNTQALTTVANLCKAARSEWQTGVALAGRGQEHAKAEYFNGWGHLLLTKLLQGWTPEANGKPDETEARNAFQQAIQDDPLNISYWELLGYASDGKQAIAAYLHALALQPKNSTLWYAVFAIHLSEARSSVSRDDIQQAIKKAPSGLEAIAALKKAIAQTPENADPMYELAYLILWSTRYDNNGMNDPGPADQKDQVNAAMEKSLTAEDKKDAAQVLALMDKAGRCSKCFTPIGGPQPPAMFTAAWKYADANVELAPSSFGEMRALARDMYGVAIADGIEHNMQGAIHAENDTIRLGYQLAGSWPTKNSTPLSQEVMGPLVGKAVIGLGYEGLIMVEQRHGSVAEVKVTRAEYDAFKQSYTNYKVKLDKYLHESIYAHY